MKRKFLIITSFILVLLLVGVAHLYIRGGEPEIENFNEVQDDYETIAEFALETYNEYSPEKEYIIIDIYGGNLEYDDTKLPLNEKQQKAALLAGEEFDYLRVSEDAVFFNKDETGYYGLVYSKHPLIALYKEEIPQRGRDYHRINSCWYEWGVWGI